MAVRMTLSGLLASVRAVTAERIIAKTNPSSIRGLSESLKERKSEWQGVKRVQTISGMIWTEGPELSGGAEQINGLEETGGQGDERLYELLKEPDSDRGCPVIQEQIENLPTERCILDQPFRKGIPRVFLGTVFWGSSPCWKESLLNSSIYHIIVLL